jgi:ketosteroid isomerase-like protein
LFLVVRGYPGLIELSWVDHGCRQIGTRIGTRRERYCPGMSQENVEIVRRLYDAWNRRDEEELLALSDPEVEFVNSPTAVEPGTRRGTNEVLAATRTQWEFLREGRFELDRIFDRGAVIFVLARLSRLMPEGETRIEDRALTSWTIRDGRVVRTEVLGFGSSEVDKALEAAGLKE